LVVVVLLLVLSLILPWWSETESIASFPGSSSWTQSYSPFNGVTGVCSLTCPPPYLSEPPLGPVVGTKSFASLGLNQTADLYLAILVLVLAAIACTVATLAIRFSTRAGSRSPRRARAGALALSSALLTTAAGSIALATLQPITLRADSMAAFGPRAPWTASPSPEVSFWGGCSVGPANGICASGWSVSWGPGAGWYLIIAAAAVLVVLHLLRTRHARSGEATPPT
jgi:hypothetical protein